MVWQLNDIPLGESLDYVGAVAIPPVKQSKKQYLHNRYAAGVGNDYLC
jgi:hypothetical protein